VTGREHPALDLPPADPAVLHGFPRWTLRPERTLFRAHRAGSGPWWFSSAPGGRWDLPGPHGTVYLADSPEAALRERLGRVLSSRSLLAATEVDATCVSQLHVPEAVRLADVCSGRAAAYGITREIHTLTPYATTQAWAAALHAVGAGGVRYDPRFSTGRVRAYAVFGEAGARRWPSGPIPSPGREVAAAAGIEVLTPPRSVRTIAPPGGSGG
jgi:hypothetical protein